MRAWESRISVVCPEVWECVPASEPTSQGPGPASSSGSGIRVRSGSTGTANSDLAGGEGELGIKSGIRTELAL